VGCEEGGGEGDVRGWVWGDVGWGRGRGREGEGGGLICVFRGGYSCVCERVYRSISRESLDPSTTE